MHTKPNAVLANSNRLTPEDLLLEADARMLWLTITGEKHGNIMLRIARTPMRWVIYRLRRENHRSCPIELLGRLIVWLANAGVSEARLRMIPLFLTRVIEECFAGNAHRTFDEVDREELQLESREHELSLERHLVSLPACEPEQLEAEALANEQEAAVQLERARLLRRQARQRRMPSTVIPFPQRKAEALS